MRGAAPPEVLSLLLKTTCFKANESSWLEDRCWNHFRQGEVRMKRGVRFSVHWRRASLSWSSADAGGWCLRVSWVLCSLHVVSSVRRAVLAPWR